MKKSEILKILNSIEISEYDTNSDGDILFLNVEYTEETFDKLVSLGLNATVLMNRYVTLDPNVDDYIIDLNLFVWRMVTSWDNEEGFK